MTAGNAATCETVGGHRPPLQSLSSGIDLSTGEGSSTHNLRRWCWRVIHQQRVDVSTWQRTLWVRPHAQICDMIGNFTPGVKHPGRNEDDVARLHLAAVSARTDCAASARASGKEVLRPRFLVLTAAGRQDSRSGQDNVDFGHLVVIRPCRRVAGFIRGWAAINDA